MISRRTQKSLPHRLSAPLEESEIRRLRAGDFIELDGPVFTARDAAHKRLAGGEEPPVSLEHAIIYHCGPVAVAAENGGWKITAAGPTTSSREEPYMARMIEQFGLRAVIGKGGMGEKTLEACSKQGCIYLHAVGGAAQVLAGVVTRIDNIFWTESGLPEAIWQLEVSGFPAIVTMDSHGESIHERVKEKSEDNLRQLLNRV